MFIDLEQYASKDKLVFDICIVGAGAAGITLARKLQRENTTIALLESGGVSLDPATQQLYDGASVGVKYMPLMASRLRYFGGTTGHWGGQSVPLEEFDFAPRSWVPDSGWPIEYQEFSSFIPEAASICGVPGGGFTWDDVQGNNSPHLPFDTANFDHLIMRFSYPPRKFGDYFHDEIGASQDISCFLNANVTGLATDNNASHVAHADVSTISKKANRIYAKKFILACGGIENSRLLLLSDSTNPDGLGNSHDQVGRFFMEHPNFDSGLVRFTDSVDVPRLKQAFHYINSPNKIRYDFRLNKDRQEKLSILNHSAFLLPGSPNQRDHMEENLSMLDRVWNRLEGAYDSIRGNESSKDENSYKLRLRLEQAPNKNSRVILGDEKDALGLRKVALDLQFTDLEKNTIQAVHQQIAQELGKQGYGRMHISYDPGEDDWTGLCDWQVHHCGGTRMSDSPAKGVVDSNCRVFGVDNLWVAGSSVFPNSGHANPTLNLVALTIRLADHINNEA